MCRECRCNFYGAAFLGERVFFSIEGRNEEVIQKCIRDQGKEDEKLGQLKLMQGMECLSIGAKEVGLR